MPCPCPALRRAVPGDRGYVRHGVAVRRDRGRHAHGRADREGHQPRPHLLPGLPEGAAARSTWSSTTCRSATGSCGRCASGRPCSSATRGRRRPGGLHQAGARRARRRGSRRSRSSSPAAATPPSCARSTSRTSPGPCRCRRSTSTRGRRGAPTRRRPDELRIDLDPMPGTGWDDVVEVALEVKALFDELGLVAYPKTAGSKGIHVYLRVRAALDLPGPAARGARRRARDRAAPARARHGEVVEGGARRAGVPRLQPDGPRPDDRVGVQRARPSRARP